ncbi:hypothetical protein Agub_g5350, partial [Astrephomene gubernaculifera]
WDCTVRIWRQQGGSDGDGGGEGDGADDQEEEEEEEGGRGGGGGAGGVGEEVEEEEGGSGGMVAATTGSSGSGSGDERSGRSSSSMRRTSTRKRSTARASNTAASITATTNANLNNESGGWNCSGVLQYGDWVYCCAVRGGNLLVAAGSEVVVTDAATGRAVRRFAGLHDGGAVGCLEGCRSGRLLFTGSGDGLLLAHDLRMKQGSRVLWHHRAAVTGLSFEDPWLASAGADGCVVLQARTAEWCGCGTSRERRPRRSGQQLLGPLAAPPRLAEPPQGSSSASSTRSSSPRQGAMRGETLSMLHQCCGSSSSSLRWLWPGGGALGGVLLLYWRLG